MAGCVHCDDDDDDDDNGGCVVLKLKTKIYLINV